jgi:glycosyltransferase involved in cell wall biosynthesis
VTPANAVAVSKPTAEMVTIGALDGPNNHEYLLRAARRVLPAHRVYLHPTTREVCPVSIIEAMEARLSVIAPWVGAIPEPSRHGAEGAFSSLHVLEFGARVLVDPLEDPPRLAKKASQARATLLCRYAAAAGPMLEDFLFDPRDTRFAGSARPDTTLAVSTKS